MYGGPPQGTTLSFTITNNFAVNKFEGKKQLIVATSSWFGGKNPFLGIAFISMGSVCIATALVFLIKHVSPGGRRKFGDLKLIA